MSAPYAMTVTRLGGPEVLEAREIPMPRAGAGELVVANTAIGVNYVDVYLRAGQPHGHNPVPPFVPGAGGAGRVVEVGEGVSGIAVGDRIAYTNAGVGSYSTHVVLAARHAVVLPAAVSEQRAAAGLLRTLTAQYLLKQMRPLVPGTRILIHAAAGGVGQIMVQWAKRLGLVVFATVGSAAKAAVARELGADTVIDYNRQDFAAEVMRITDGAGVSVVYDSVGRTTFMGSLACLEPKGLVVNYGTASGQVEGFALQELHAKSLWVCRPTLRTYIARREDLLAMCEEAFALLADPTLRLDMESPLPLREAAQAHRLLESRTARGAIVLVPEQ